jgi:hypothetical protein
MKKMLKKFYKRLMTKTPDEIEWEEYTINKRTVEGLEHNLINLKNQLTFEKNKNYALENKVYNVIGCSEIRYLQKYDKNYNKYIEVILK